MKPAREWLDELKGVAVPPELEIADGRGGEATLKAGGVYVHSRYRPREEAARLIESAGLEPGRPVLVAGLGLGYHVLELAARGFDVAVAEPDAAVARLALEGPMRESEVFLGVGEADAIAAAGAFAAFAKRRPQLFVHPWLARTCPAFVEAMEAQLAKAAIAGERLGVAVVGPMYGGSLPIAGYLERAFRGLGHRTLLVDNRLGWDLYDAMSGSVKSKKAAGQLTGLLVNLLGQWSYARVAEFEPEICIVMAQAPVDAQFPRRLAAEGIATAFWFVENWRHMGYWRDIAPAYDCFFHIQPGPFEQQLTEAGCRHHAFVQTGCDPDIHRPVELSDAERAEFGCQLSFAGAGYHNRNQLFSGLTDYDLKLWGVDWTARELQPFVCKAGERFTPERFAKIVAGSAINLNLHSSATHSGVDPDCDAINPRVFEIAACGGFQVCDPCRGLDQFFDFDTELPVYRDLAGLRRLIDHSLAHPDERERVAAAARARVLRDHTYEKRAQQMLDFILERCGGRILKKEIRVQRTMAEVAERVGRDTELGRYLASLPPDLMFTQEALNERIPAMGSRLSHPEAVFAYLREMRNSADALLEAMD
ncbi:MAG: glycosyltransferase [Candidatus Hydrogenedentes bacterium]|nr:glycosyltransferase [Candidatus Hydrogenedentota bacterium]